MTNNAQLPMATGQNPEEDRLARNLGLTREKAIPYYVRSLEAYTQRDLENAILDISEAIYYDQRFSEYYATRGLYYIEDLKWEEARVDLQYAMRLNKREWLAYYLLATLDFQVERDVDSALERLTVALQFAPKRPELWFYRAVMYHYDENDDKAIDDMLKAVVLMPMDDKRQKEAQAWLRTFGYKDAKEKPAETDAAPKTAKPVKAAKPRTENVSKK